MKKTKLIHIILILLIFIVGSYAWHSDVQNLLAYGWADWPTHDAFSGRRWVKKAFSKITLFEQDCSDPSLSAPLSENSDGTAVQTQPTKYGYSFKLQLVSKPLSESPSDVVKEWYHNSHPISKKYVQFKTRTSHLTT